ncbi:MAG: hypothetical protein AB8G16_19660 [Gammaproteobacteria bacterium]
MTTVLRALTLMLAAMTALQVHAQSVEQQWRDGLDGAKLASYSGSNITSNSTLTTIEFCRGGRYRYYKEGSWSVPGQAGGASQSVITGTWGIMVYGVSTMLTYQTDAGEKGAFPISLQKNGKVNIGGAAYAVERGGASC